MMAHLMELSDSDSFVKVSLPLSRTQEMLESGTDGDPNDLCDHEPGYVHSVAPDPRRLDPLDNPVSWPLSNRCIPNHFNMHLAYRGRRMSCNYRTEEILRV